MKYKLTCPGCGFIFDIDQYDHEDCSNCGKYHCYWDDDWNYITEEEGFPGFYWEKCNK